MVSRSRSAVVASAAVLIACALLASPQSATAGESESPVPGLELPEFPATSPQGVIDLATFPVGLGFASYRVERAFEQPYVAETAQLLTLWTFHVVRPRSELWLSADLFEGYFWLCRAHHGGSPACHAIGKDDVEAQLAAFEAVLGAFGFFQRDRIEGWFKPLLRSGRVSQGHFGRVPVSCLQGRTVRGGRKLCVTPTFMPTVLRIDDRLRVRARSYVVDFPIEYLLPPVPVAGLPDLASLEDSITKRMAIARTHLVLRGGLVGP